jgi:hypothetical protein
MEVIGKTTADIKSGFKHPVALFLFGMLFAAFLFPPVARMLGGWKAKGGTVSKFIPNSFTRSA